MAKTSEKWNRKIDFLFACAGGAIGLGNVWRFPYICFENGGGAFLIPYLTAAAVIGFPLFYLESCLGQLTGGDMIKSWNLFPLFKGIGFANLVIQFFALTYYNVVLAWLARYLVASFQSVLPWTTCNNTWNSEACISLMNIENTSSNSIIEDGNMTEVVRVTSVEEFWKNKALQISSNIYEFGYLNKELAGCIVVLWILVYFCIWRGVKWTSNIVYFTVPIPYVLLLVVLVRGLTLDGASVGIRYYLKPNITSILNAQVWVKAVEQISFSYAVGWGIIATLAGHNKFHHKFSRDAAIIVFLNIGTSLLSGFAVFSVLGHMAQLQNVSVASVVKSGPGLAFIAYPKALSFLPLPQLWSVLFFLMMLFLSLDSEFVGLECLTLTSFNLLPNKIKDRKWAYEIFTALLLSVLCLMSLVMVTEGGYYVFRVFEFGSSGWCVIFILFCESVAIGWGVGADRFLKYASEMLKRKHPIIGVYLKINWKFIIPIATPVLAGLSLKRNSSVYYSDGTPFPAWAMLFAWSMVFASVLMVPFLMVRLFFSKQGTVMERLRNMIRVDESACMLKQKEPSLDDIDSTERIEKELMLITVP